MAEATDGPSSGAPAGNGGNCLPQSRSLTSAAEGWSARAQRACQTGAAEATSAAAPPPPLQPTGGLHQCRRLLEGRLAHPPKSAAPANGNVRGDKGVPAVPAEAPARQNRAGVLLRQRGRGLLEGKERVPGRGQMDRPVVTSQLPHHR